MKKSNCGRGSESGEKQERGMYPRKRASS